MTTTVLKEEDEILAYTHNIRERVVSSLIQKGIPEDYAAISLLNSTLKDMDQSALTRKRIKSDEKVVDRGAQAAEVFAQLLMNGNIRGLYKTDVIENRVIPTLGNEIPDVVLVPGETDIGVGNDTYENFMAKQKAIMDADL